MKDSDVFRQIALARNVDFERAFLYVPALREMENCSQKHPAHCWDVLNHTRRVIYLLPYPSDLPTRLTAIFHDSGKPRVKVIGEDGCEHFRGHEEESSKIAFEALQRLGFSGNIVELVPKAVLLHDKRLALTEEELEEKVHLHGKAFCRIILTHQIADLLAHSQYHINKKRKERVLIRLYRFSRLLKKF